jgi:hypothetical protein
MPPWVCYDELQQVLEKGGMNRKCVVTFLTLLALVCLCGSAFSAPRVRRYTFCRAVASAESDYRPIRESTRFYTTDIEVYSWTELLNVMGAHTVHWLWIDPVKLDSFVSSYRIPAGADPDLPYYVWCNMYLDNGSIPIGEWRVLVYLDGKFLYEDSFTLVPGWLDEMGSNDRPSQAEPVQMGEQIHGFTARDDEDWYTMTIARTGQYYVNLSKYWSYTQLMLSVFAADDLETPIAHLDDRENTGWAGGYWQECVMLTRPGVYYIRVQGHSSALSPTEYWLNLKERMPWWIE